MFFQNQKGYNHGQCVIEPISDKGGIWISGIDFAKNLSNLQANKIGAVVSAVGLQLRHPPSVKVIMFNLDDSCTQGIADCFQPCFQFMEENLKKTNVLVHCAAGISRSSAMLISYLMRKYGWKFQKAFELVKSKRTFVYPNSGFQKQLLQYQKKLGL